jgi:hypothetical protein
LETQFRPDSTMQDAVEVGGTPVGLPIGGSLNEIVRMHPESDGIVKDPIGDEDSSAAQPRMQSSRRTGKSSLT